MATRSLRLSKITTDFRISGLRIREQGRRGFHGNSPQRALRGPGVKVLEAVRPSHYVVQLRSGRCAPRASASETCLAISDSSLSNHWMVSNSSLMRRRRSTIILFVAALSLGNKCPWSLTMHVTIAPPTKPNTNAQRTSCLFMTFPFYQSRACSNHFDPPRLPEWGTCLVSGKSLGIGNRLSELGDESNGNILLSCEPLVLP